MERGCDGLCAIASVPWVVGVPRGRSAASGRCGALLKPTGIVAVNRSWFHLPEYYCRFHFHFHFQTEHYYYLTADVGS
jgi:hypothetical protein